MGGSLIVLDMIKKIDARITHKHYSLENGIFTLQIDVGDYDLTNKTITAKFTPKEVETGRLDVIDGIINLPIHSNLLDYDANYIQLNFRWDENKLEQSPKMMWNISPSLAATEAAQEDVDIISYLINEIQAAKATADRMLEDAGDVRIELDESTASATAINNTLADPVTGTIKLATDANATLSQSIIDAGLADGALTDPVTGAIVLAEAAEDALTNPITGAIKLAEDAKGDIEQAILDNEIVTQTEFVAHKEDYANLNNRVDEIITTPVPVGEVIAQEIIDARQEELSLGANLSKVKEQINSLDGKFQSILDDESAPLGIELVDDTGWMTSGWVGDFATGFTHTVGNVLPLKRTISATGTNLYLIEFDVYPALEARELYVTIGNSEPFDLYIGNVTHQSLGIKSISDGDLVFTPISGFNKTISNISVKQIMGSTQPTFFIKDSKKENPVEIRPTLARLFNVFFGTNAGKFNTKGHSNLAFGSNALENNTTGFWNCALGKDTLNSNTVGSRNVAIGYASLIRNVSGQRNQSIGSFSMQNNISGNKNVSIGSDALDNNISGSYNTAIGFASMYANTTGNSNIAIGTTALSQNESGGSNIAIGENAINYNKIGSYNVAIGRNALLWNNADNNVAIGKASLRSNKTGVNNVSIGAESMFLGDVGSSNVSIGYSSMYKNTGSYNVGIGLNSMYHNVGGNNNTAIGYNSGRGVTGSGFSNSTLIGFYAGYALTTGSNNIMIGYQCGDNIKTGNNNIMIAYNLDAPADNINNYLNIGGVITGDLITRLIEMENLKLTKLPTVNPNVPGQIWNDNGTLKVS